MQYKIEPWGHQVRGIERATPLPYFAFLFEQGAGKTMTSINTLRAKMNVKKTLFRTLIFCPPIVILNWKAEWLLHSHLSPKKIVPLMGAGKQRLKTFQALSLEPRIFITNYESLLMAPLWKAFQAWQPEAIVFDEAHKLKNPTSKRSKLAYLLANP